MELINRSLEQRKVIKSTKPDPVGMEKAKSKFVELIKDPDIRGVLIRLRDK